MVYGCHCGMRKTSPPTREGFRTQSGGLGHVDVRSFAQREVFTLQSLGTHLPVIVELCAIGSVFKLAWETTSCVCWSRWSADTHAASLRAAVSGLRERRKQDSKFASESMLEPTASDSRKAGSQSAATNSCRLFPSVKLQSVQSFAKRGPVAQQRMAQIWCRDRHLRAFAVSPHRKSRVLVNTSPIPALQNFLSAGFHLPWERRASWKDAVLSKLCR
jgi:hypothetical protein